MGKGQALRQSSVMEVIEFVACLTGTSAAGSQTALNKMLEIDLIPQCWDKSPESNGPLF